MPHVAIPNDLSGVVAGNLSGDSVNEYAYVWDGSDPGWTLNLRRRQYAELALVFAASGPSVKEIVALRSALPAYAARSAAEILSALRGCQRVALGTHLAFEAKGIASRCRGAGLTVEWVAREVSRYMLSNNVTGSWLIIEDNGLARSVYDRAMREGIRVVHTDA
ncbi:hypothetical protein ACUDTJ_08585 [Stenotrophomonas pavanii]|uniref:hypothetical protein n=1 Tax=Stenotrophomonas TaxID=40323 RepID=UPI0006C50454|nr:hypothetical protein [Stenotrophomonas sp. Sm5341]KAA3602603.1 hypothetical protein D1178_05300 [Stenotrophomonas maltophilia]KOO79065.1 hypothetical protein VO93_10965 [Stenotrophomonas maltophilia]MBN5174963.1 hypothetical protein [Stenotrophomonas maltophilia]MCU1123154.1 hypothetical protein [Stenotrophomonas maltophilia]MDQ7283754.1 hypothetical protein [Stenotrophomonas sp. Sm5341]